jgi:hypothetical protein
MTLMTTVAGRPGDRLAAGGRHAAARIARAGEPVGSRSPVA